MFEGIIVYKQWHKKEKRWYALMYDPVTKKHTSMSWARYLMSLSLGRCLDPNIETVDHKNDDKTDDRLDNLQLLNRIDNVKKAAKGKTMVTLNCPQCNIEFIREKRQTHLTKGGIRTFCSRSCSVRFNKPSSYR